MLVQLSCTRPTGALIAHNSLLYYVKGSNITFLWDFGDGTPRVNTTTPYVYHAYTKRGCYFVNNTAYNIISSNSSALTKVCVEDALMGLQINSSISASSIVTPFLISLSQGSDYNCTLWPGDGNFDV
jgi:hypothetical protein